MTVSNRLQITELAETQNNRSVTVNEAIAKLEAGACLFGAVSVLDNAPPGSPAEGGIYVVGTSGTGAWSGHNNAVAVYYNAAWLFLPALQGMQVYAADEDSYYYFDASNAWTLISSSGGLGNVTGPGSSISGNVATFSGTGGDTIQDSGIAFSTDATLSSNSNSKAPTEQAVKGYVDGKVSGLSWKQAVRAATTANGTLSTAFENGDTIDGVVLATGDRILIKNQSSGSENGIYTVNASGSPSRATDADSGAELVNASVYVSEGTTLADTQWTCTTNAPITVGSTSLTFAQAGIGGFTAASTTEVLTGTDTSKGATPDAIAALWEKGADTASAGTVSLGEGGYFHITGTTTITDIDWATAKDGRHAWVIFDGILTLTHNSTTLKLPGGANITTAAGDRACFVQDNNDNVICLVYVRADGTPLLSSILRSDTSANLTKGFTATGFSAGTKTTGNFTPDPTNGNLQYATNGGVHSLLVPSTGSGDAVSMAILYTNNGSAGAITTSAFTKITGDTPDTTNGNKFMYYITVLNSVSHLNIVAMQ